MTPSAVRRSTRVPLIGAPSHSLQPTAGYPADDSTINFMTSSRTDEVVAIFNTNPDLVALVRFALERAGFVVVIGHIHDLRSGALDLPDFLQQHNPRVIVYDLVMPYDRNWAFMRHVR